MNTLLEDVPVVLPPVVKVIQDSSVRSDIITSVISGVITSIIAALIAYYISKKQSKKSEKIAKEMRELDLKNQKDFLLLQHKINESSNSLELCNELSADFNSFYKEYTEWLDSSLNRDEIQEVYGVASAQDRISKNITLLSNKLIFLGIGTKYLSEFNESYKSLIESINKIIIKSYSKSKIIEKDILEIMSDNSTKYQQAISLLSTLKANVVSKDLEILTELKK